MLQRDYILEIVSQFADSISRSLRLAVREKDLGAAQDVESEVAELLELDRATALALTPDSLVTMMVLSGVGDAIAGYVCYALERLALVYGEAGDADTAGLRHLQAQAVAESFGVDMNVVPEELIQLEAELS